MRSLASVATATLSVTNRHDDHDLSPKILRPRAISGLSPLASERGIIAMEMSGRMNERTITDFAEAGVDHISVCPRENSAPDPSIRIAIDSLDDGSGQENPQSP